MWRKNGTMNELKFVTAGQPICNGSAGYEKAFDILEKLKLDGLELEFVHGVRMSPANQELVKKISKEKNMVLTAHGPYYINLNSKEEEKIDASITRILETARMGYSLGAFSITYHAAFYMGMAADEVFKKVEKMPTMWKKTCTTLLS
jgi:deoxyribonuclease-4